MHKTIYALLAAAIISSIAIVNIAQAQTSKRDDRAYRETAAELKADIWGMDLPHFKEYNVPERYKGYSKVILASYTDLSAGAGSHGRIRRGRTNITQISRQLIKLNDAVAVKEYSELSYTQLAKKSSYAVNYKVSSFLGVRLIKPDGKITEIDADEVVLTKDESAERKAKLAIPGLQPGDILDYYVANEVLVDLAMIRSLPFYFELYDDAPTLHYSLHCAIGEKFAAEYRCFNGAPDFVSSEDEDGSNILDLNTDSVLYVTPGTFWTSPQRQFPMIQLNVVRGNAMPYTPFTRRFPGELIKNQIPEKIIRDEMIDIDNMKLYVSTLINTDFRKNSDVVDDYYKELRKSGRLQYDSSAAELYYMFRFDAMFGQARNPNAMGIVRMAKENFNSSMFSYMLSEYLRKHKFETELVLTTSNNGSRMTEVMNKGEIYYLCNVRGKTDMIFGATDYYSPAFYIPAALEGAKGAVAVDNRSSNGLASLYKTRNFQTPLYGADESKHKEALTIIPDAESNKVHVQRTTSLTGHYKESTQKTLLLLEDFYNYERTFFKDDKTLVERVADKQSKKIAEELTAAFAAARKEQKDDFKEEAKEWLGLEISDMDSSRIINPGVRHTAPAFEFASSFQVDGIMKRAGNNQMIEVGKLIGSYSRVKEEQRNRSVDVYGPFARTVTVEMSVRVPEGYTVEGLEELNKIIRNEQGSFTASARLEGDVVKISVESVISSRYYASKDWPALVAIMDARSDWNGSKLLLRKKPA